MTKTPYSFPRFFEPTERGLEQAQQRASENDFILHVYSPSVDRNGNPATFTERSFYALTTRPEKYPRSTVIREGQK